MQVEIYNNEKLERAKISPKGEGLQCSLVTHVCRTLHITMWRVSVTSTCSPSNVEGNAQKTERHTSASQPDSARCVSLFRGEEWSVGTSTAETESKRRHPNIPRGG